MTRGYVLFATFAVVLGACGGFAPPGPSSRTALLGRQQSRRIRHSSSTSNSFRFCHRRHGCRHRRPRKAARLLLASALPPFVAYCRGYISGAKAPVFEISCTDPFAST